MEEHERRAMQVARRFSLAGRIAATQFAKKCRLRLEFRLQAVWDVHHFLPRERGTPNEMPACFGGNVCHTPVVNGKTGA
jgi:hypothetical protein